MCKGIKNASLRFFSERVLGIRIFTHLCNETVDDHRLLVAA